MNRVLLRSVFVSLSCGAPANPGARAARATPLTRPTPLEVDANTVAWQRIQ